MTKSEYLALAAILDAEDSKKAAEARLRRADREARAAARQWNEADHMQRRVVDYVNHNRRDSYEDDYRPLDVVYNHNYNEPADELTAGDVLRTLGNIAGTARRILYGNGRW